MKSVEKEDEEEVWSYGEGEGSREERLYMGNGQ